MTGSASRRCWGCGQTGHVARQCPHQARVEVAEVKAKVAEIEDRLRCHFHFAFDRINTLEKNEEKADERLKKNVKAHDQIKEKIEATINERIETAIAMKFDEKMETMIETKIGTKIVIETQLEINYVNQSCKFRTKRFLYQRYQQ